MSDATKKPHIVVSGDFGMCDKRTRSGRVYPRDVMEKAIANYQPKIDEGRAFGDICDGETVSRNLQLKNVSYRMLSLSVDEDGTIKGKAHVLNTSCGRNLEAVLKSGLPYTVQGYIHGVGSVDNGGVVQDDFSIRSTSVQVELVPSMSASVKKATNDD